MELQGLIFDCDGTLADTMPLHWQAWQILLRKYGLIFPKDRFYEWGGIPSRDILRQLSREQNVDLDALEGAREKEQAYLPLIPQARTIQPTLQVVREHHGRIPLAVASGGSRKAVGTLLIHLGIRHYFDAVVTNEDVQRQKPAPDIFLEAACRIGVDPRFCRAYEDTETGLKAIRAAGMQAVDVRTLTA